MVTYLLVHRFAKRRFRVEIEAPAISLVHASGPGSLTTLLAQRLVVVRSDRSENDRSADGAGDVGFGDDTLDLLVFHYEYSGVVFEVGFHVTYWRIRFDGDV